MREKRDYSFPVWTSNWSRARRICSHMVNPSKKKIPIYDSKNESLFPFQRSTPLHILCHDVGHRVYFHHENFGSPWCFSFIYANINALLNVLIDLLFTPKHTQGIPCQYQGLNCPLEVISVKQIHFNWVFNESSIYCKMKPQVSHKVWDFIRLWSCICNTKWEKH